MNIAQALNCSQSLSASESAKLDTELLLAHAMQCTRTYLYTWPERTLTQSQSSAFMALVRRRSEGEPIAYILQTREFWSLPLEVSPATLIPRPDTEVLVEEALKLLNRPAQGARPAKVLDLGTGTGAIALALAKECAYASVLGVDLSIDAVALAERNRVALGLTNLTFAQSDWFSSVQDQFDLVVSNPPYIDENDPHLTQGDVRFEPSSALVAANQGLADIQQIIQQSSGYLIAGGWLLLEHGCSQSMEVQKLLKASHFTDVFTRRDYGDNDRVTAGCWLGS